MNNSRDSFCVSSIFVLICCFIFCFYWDKINFLLPGETLDFFLLFFFPVILFLIVLILNFVYLKVTNFSKKITDYLAEARDIVIFKTANNLSKNDLSRYRNLQFILISSSVESIEEAAFVGCSKLEKVCIEAKIKEIPPYTFAGCTELREIELPESIEKIEKNAFLGCSNLKIIILRCSYFHFRKLLKENKNFSESIFSDCYIKLEDRKCSVKLSKLKK